MLIFKVIFRFVECPVVAHPCLQNYCCREQESKKKKKKGGKIVGEGDALFHKPSRIRIMWVFFVDEELKKNLVLALR